MYVQPDEAGIIAAVELSRTGILPNRFPDKAIDLIERQGKLSSR